MHTLRGTDQIRSGQIHITKITSIKTAIAFAKAVDSVPPMSNTLKTLWISAKLCRGALLSVTSTRTLMGTPDQIRSDLHPPSKTHKMGGNA
jgi:hypothetical protein